MPFARPDLPTLIERAVTDIESRLPGADARLRRSNLNVLARVHAGAVHGVYGYLDWLARQLLVDTAEREYLDRHASIWLEQGRRAATYAAGQIMVTGTNGASVPAGTAFKRADGVVYVSQTEASILGGEASVTVVAEVAGAAGNAAAGTAVVLDSPIVGVNAAAQVAAMTGGADVEQDDTLQERVKERIREAPQGGNDHDYVVWAKEVPGVTRAWCYPRELGPGTVTVRFVRDDDEDLIPDAAALAAVFDHIEEQRPTTAELFVVAPIPVPLNPQIQIFPATASVKEAVEFELSDLLRREASPGVTIKLSRIKEAISRAAGEEDHVLVHPTANVLHGTGEMAVLGDITWL